MNSVSIHGNQVHWTWFMCIETEFDELGFYTWKPSSLNSISMSHPCPISPDGHVGTELEIEPTRLNFRKWSQAFHVLPWVPAGDLFSSLSISLYLRYLRLLSLHSSQYTQSSETLLHYTHLTQHLRYTILYLLVFFFVKKNLEHIRKSYVFFFFLVSVNIVINLFVSM